MELAVQVSRLEEILAQLAAAEARTASHVEELAAAQADLTAAQTRTEARLGTLAAAQARAEGRLEELAAAQTRTEARLGTLASAQTRTEEQLRALLGWQRGEDGRRKGERYERDIARRAPSLFQGGEGGATDRESVQRRLAALLAARPESPEAGLPPEGDPFLADLVWWKGDRVALVEVSLVVDEDDVNRAHRCAETLRHAGAQALPVVVGDNWADGETRALAELLRLAWKVGDDLSERFIALRRQPGQPAAPSSTGG